MGSSSAGTGTAREAGPRRFERPTAGTGGRPPSGALAALLVLAVLLAFFPAFEAGFVWDDDGHLTRSELRSLDGLARIWSEPESTQQYYPLLHTLFWVEHRLWGERPLPYHLANVLLHAGAALVAWRVLARLAVPGAFLAALLWALHPVQAESVAWISEQKNTLSLLLALASLHVWLGGDAGGRADGAPRGSRWALAFLLFLCALLAKTVTAVLPGVIVVIAWWRGGRLPERRTWLALAPFFAASAAAGLATAWLERHVGGAGSVLSAAERVLLAGRVPWSYAGKLVWPAELCFVYPRFELDPSSIAQWSFPAATLALLAALWLARDRIGRGPLAATLCYGGILFPALGFFDVLPFAYSFVADHFQYAASLAPIALFAAGAARAHGRLRGGGRAALSLGAVALTATLACLSFVHTRDFRDEETLWRATVARNPGAFLAWNNLASLLNAERRFAEALDAADRGLAAKPDDARAHTNRAIALQNLGRLVEARLTLERAVELDDRDPAARVNLGSVLLALGRAEEALAVLEAAVVLAPSLATARINLANALLAAGRSDEAILEYERAIGIDSRSAQAWYNLGVARGQRRERELARHAYERAIALDPDALEARFNLAIVELQAGREAEARAQIEELLRRDPAGPLAARAREVLAQHLAR